MSEDELKELQKKGKDNAAVKKAVAQLEAYLKELEEDKEKNKDEIKKVKAKLQILNGKKDKKFPVWGIILIIAGALGLIGLVQFFQCMPKGNQDM